MFKSLLALFPLAWPLVEAWEYPTLSQHCLNSCHESAGVVPFTTYVETDDWFTGVCRDTLRFQSAYLCAQQRCSRKEIEDGLDYLQWLCDHVPLTIPSYSSVIANFTAAEVNAMPVIKQDDEFEDPVDHPMLPSEELHDLTVRTWVSMLPVMN
jgi:hypothetical protein